MKDINVTPLVDVMLVLVVIFLLATPLLASSLRLDLPRAAGSAPAATAQAVTVAVDAGGQIFLNDQPLTPAALAQQLQALASHRPDTEVQLRADTAVPYGRVVEVIAAAQAAGLQRIGFVTQPVPEAPAQQPTEHQN